MLKVPMFHWNLVITGLFSKFFNSDRIQHSSLYSNHVLDKNEAKSNCLLCVPIK